MSMKLRLLLPIALLATPVLGADADSKSAKSDLAAATRKLAEQPNYSWTSTPKTEGSQSGRKQGPIEGKTEKNGITHLKLSSGDNTYELAFKGNKIAVKLSEDWIEPSDLPIDDGRFERRLKAYKVPAQEAEELLGKATELKQEADGPYTSELAPDAAKTLFAQLGRRAAEAPSAKGTVKFWVKDGVLAKYEYTVQGKITVGTDKREIDISRTTTVVVKDVGATKINLPESARSRLAS